MLPSAENRRNMDRAFRSQGDFPFGETIALPSISKKQDLMHVYVVNDAEQESHSQNHPPPKRPSHREEIAILHRRAKNVIANMHSRQASS